jgi:hypothetical protein
MPRFDTGRFQDNAVVNAVAQHTHSTALTGCQEDAYGELPLSMAVGLFRDLQLSKADVFEDLGSGLGKLPTAAALFGGARRALGVELSVHRHRLACAGLAAVSEALRAKFPAGAANRTYAQVELHWGDLLDEDLTNVTAIYASSMCFRRALMNLMGKRFETQLPGGARVALTTLLVEPNSPRLHALKTHRSGAGNIFLYRAQGNASPAAAAVRAAAPQKRPVKAVRPKTTGNNTVDSTKSAENLARAATKAPSRHSVKTDAQAVRPKTMGNNTVDSTKSAENLARAATKAPGRHSVKTDAQAVRPKTTGNNTVDTTKSVDNLARAATKAASRHPVKNATQAQSSKSAVAEAKLVGRSNTTSKVDDLTVGSMVVVVAATDAHYQQRGVVEKNAGGWVAVRLGSERISYRSYELSKEVVADPTAFNASASAAQSLAPAERMEEDAPLRTRINSSDVTVVTTNSSNATATAPSDAKANSSNATVEAAELEANSSKVVVAASERLGNATAFRAEANAGKASVTE